MFANEIIHNMESQQSNSQASSSSNVKAQWNTDTIGTSMIQDIAEDVKKHGDKKSGSDTPPGSRKKEEERKSASDQESTFKKQRLKSKDGKPTGFARGLNAEKIIGATNDPGDIYFLIKWQGEEEEDLVPAKEANVKIPQMVIKFYQEHLNWYEDDN